MPRALITGVAGQDGSFLAEDLLAEGFEVHGTVRPGQPADPSGHPRLAHLAGRPGLALHPLDLLDHAALAALVEALAPDECYHLTGTRPPADDPGREGDLLEGAIGTTRALLAALHRAAPRGACFFAASSEVFETGGAGPCHEGTPVAPRSAYAIAKAAGLWLVRQRREALGQRACAGLLFNHESARRGPGFVTRAVSAGAARVKLGLASELRLGDLSARRDWGHARSYTRAMRLMLRRERPEDLVLATGRAHTVEQLVAAAFAHLDLDWRRHVVVDPSIPRPDRPGLVGDPSRAAALLGWRDEVPFERLVAELVDDDLARLRAGGGPAPEGTAPPRR